MTEHSAHSAHSVHTEQSRVMGLTVKNHWLECPWDYSDNAASSGASVSFTLYARELVPDGGEDLPALLYLQGGPGSPAPRPLDSTSGLIGEALKHYRVVLLDQRGTGHSHRIDEGCEPEDLSLERLVHLRQDNIVGDAERLREALGEEQWSLYGQSFGGFCITSYCSLFPESVRECFLTGGLPSLDRPIDVVYRETYSAIAVRHGHLYERFPWMDRRIREIGHHLDNSQEILPTGERLSSRRFRTIGINLGRGHGLHSLAYLLEDPFRTVRGEKRLTTDVLTAIGAQVSFAGAPLYAAIHESIYGGVAVSGEADQRATLWSAHRIREEIPGFEENADPRGDDPYYLTGEHIYPWQFQEDPALHAFAESAEALAQWQWSSSPYDTDVLAERAPVGAGVVYLDDAFVPFERSRVAASKYRDMRIHVTNALQHDGIRTDGAELFRTLREKVNEY
ncbi:alpha/beta hydrolase [Corynebacterium falsenii]|nr:alpha/beta fold hydrolase [Corynebacterium falsenii]UBI06221.1 alpha/beta hydrolase [Corynebacterium falsenii]